jgi:hypothetical protein
MGDDTFPVISFSFRALRALPIRCCPVNCVFFSFFVSFLALFSSFPRVLFCSALFGASAPLIPCSVLVPIAEMNFCFYSICILALVEKGSSDTLSQLFAGQSCCRCKIRVTCLSLLCRDDEQTRHSTANVRAIPAAKQKWMMLSS